MEVYWDSRERQRCVKMYLSPRQAREQGSFDTPSSSLFLLQIFYQFGRQIECVVFVNIYDYRIQADFFLAFLSDRHDVAERRDIDLFLFVLYNQ